MTDPDFVTMARELLSRLEREDPNRKIFGAASHRYQLNPAIDVEALARREQELGITLPSPYRAFLTELGNGGAGPSYGVFPFEGGDSEDYTKYGNLAQPYAYTRAHNPTGLIDDGEDEDDDDDDDDENDEDPKQRYWEAFDDRGALYICHHGCGSRSMLIVSGPARGQVWSDNVADDGGYSPKLDAHGSVCTFASWYLAWLEQSLAKLTSSRT